MAVAGVFLTGTGNKQSYATLFIAASMVSKIILITLIRVIHPKLLYN